MRRALLLPLFLLMVMFAPIAPAVAKDCPSGHICGGTGGQPPGPFGAHVKTDAPSTVKVGATFTVKATASSKPKTFKFQQKDANSAWATIRTVKATSKTAVVSLKAPNGTGKRSYRVIGFWDGGSATSNTKTVTFTL